MSPRRGGAGGLGTARRRRRLLAAGLGLMLPTASPRLWAAGGSPPRPVYTVRLEGRTRQTNDAVLPLVKKLQDDLGKSPWDVGVENASGSGKNEKEIPRELKAPGRFYFYGRTQ